MPNIEHVPEEKARLNMTLASEDGEELDQMLQMLDNIEAGQAAQMTFEADEDADKTMKALAKATRVSAIKIRKEQYTDRSDRKVVSIFLAVSPQQSRGRRKNEGG